LGGKVADGYEQIHALFEAEEVVKAAVPPGDVGALLRYYQKEIKKIDGGDFKVEIDDEFMPSLEIKGKHAGHVSDFVEALQAMVESIKEFIETAPGLVEQLAEFGQECADFPSKIQDEAAGMSPLKIPGALKKTSDNIKYLGGVPNEFKEVYENVKDFLKLLKQVAEETA
jgi:hypothetical protein